MSAANLRRLPLRDLRKRDLAAYPAAHAAMINKSLNILSLVERGGSVRSFHVPVATKVTVTEIAKANVAHEAKLFTDESRFYGEARGHFAEHSTVRHSAGEYARNDCWARRCTRCPAIFLCEGRSE